MSREADDWQMLPRPFVVAHRGGNELSRAREASAAGADVLEADLWLYRGQLEVRHEKTLGPLPVLWDRWSLAPGWKPRLRLASVIEVVDPQIELMLDLKGRAGSDPAIAAHVATVINGHRGDRPYLVCSQNWPLLEAFRHNPGARLVHSIGNQQQLDTAWTKLERDDHDAVSIHVKLLNAAVVSALKERIAIVMTWPINHPDQLEVVLGWGVDGVTTDRLDIVERVRALRQPV
jgi:glycerophosphoryl diester phosphodiesterase